MEPGLRVKEQRRKEQGLRGDQHRPVGKEPRPSLSGRPPLDTHSEARLTAPGPEPRSLPAREGLLVIILSPTPIFCFFFLFIFLSFSFMFISWRLTTLQYCSGFATHRHESAWSYTCSPPRSPLPPPSPSHPLGPPGAPGPSTRLMPPAWTGGLFDPG